MRAQHSNYQLRQNECLKNYHYLNLSFYSARCFNLIEKKTSYSNKVTGDKVK